MDDRVFDKLEKRILIQILTLPLEVSTLMRIRLFANSIETLQHI
jgi:hypothetical protein